MPHPTRSRKRSRDAALWHSLGHAEAGRVVAMAYGDNAGAEVLLRAFLGERDCNRAAARFWITVYERLAPRGAAGAGGEDGA
jgi:hypothetical protein